MRKRSQFVSAAILILLMLAVSACKVESSARPFVPPTPLSTQTQTQVTLTPAPTRSATSTSAAIPTATAFLTETPVDPPTSTASSLPVTSECTAGWTRLAAGQSARVSEANSAPNRLRSDPSLAGTVIAQLAPGTPLNLLEGPLCADGLIFWRVETTSNLAETGWTAEGDGTEYWLEPPTP